MDFLTSEQLHQYQDIIDQINSAFAEKDRLKKQQELINNKIIVQNLTSSRAVQKVAHVNLKIFSKASDVMKLYEDEIQSNSVFKSENCKYYVVEIYIMNALLQKLCVEQWFLNVCVHHKNMYISKTVKLRNSSPIIEVIPVYEEVIESILQVTLVPTDNRQSTVSLDQQRIDISYHFEMYKKGRHKSNTAQKFLQINKLYNDNNELRELLNQPQEFSLCCQAKSSNFKADFLKNCYHNIGIEQFSNFEDEPSDFSIQFVCKYSKAEAIISSHEVKIKCSIADLDLLKQYFYSLLKKYKTLGLTEEAKLQEIEKIKSTVANSNAAEVFTSLQRLRSRLF
ncbi:unnamed protein product [Callosobruchus maculatus]|uniref:Uncharacterized protein n=1 Tax=Callosobruchus maculatus TaxID=64391 RepID=A0A653CKV5_CALMS|nr:unnamed protein product [Callosobruchus maculatus]